MTASTTPPTARNAGQTVVGEDPGSVGRRERAQDARVGGDPVHPERRDDHEPNEHHGAEQPADRASPAAL